MTVTATLARDEAIADALRVATAVIGDDPASEQALKIIAAIKRLRAADPVKVAQLAAVNYMARLQEAARARWKAQYRETDTGPGFDAVAGIETPIGRFRVVTWRRAWRGGRIAWASEYYLNDEPITVAEIEAAGLAQRPTTRNRQRRG